MATKQRKAPWKRAAPKTSHHTSLTAAQKRHAKARAEEAGRSYPNLVDNMHEAAASGGARKKSPRRKAAAKKTGARKTAAKKTSTRSARTGTRKTAAKKTRQSETGARKTATKKTRRSAKTSARKTAAKKSTRSTKSGARTKRAPAKRRRAAPRSARVKDPRGALTAAGRRALRERDGSQLKPGVTKPEREMTPAEMHRKGSWAARFYGRAKLPALTYRDGKPTRFALSAHAWGEPVPKTEAAARRIAAKGRRLLARATKAERA